MITIQVLGLDQFVVGHYSKNHTEAIAGIFGVSSDEVSFFAPNSMMFHEGVEQTSWNTLLIVRAPKGYASAEKKVAEYILTTFVDFSVNLSIEFDYYEEGSRYSFVNEKYPRFLHADQIREVTLDNEEFYDGDEEEEEGETEGKPEETPSDIFLGNAFEGFDEKYEAAKKNK